MKIQFLNGGLANQTFQYLFARYYELSHPGQIMYMDDSYFALNTVHNGYELEKVFGVKPHMLSECFDKDIWNYMLEEKKNGKSVPQILFDNGLNICMISEVSNYGIFNPFDGKIWMMPVHECNPEILDYNEYENIYFHGYWIHHGFFYAYEDVFRKELSFPKITDERNADYLKQICGDKSAAVHVRRGDYITVGLAAAAEIIGTHVDAFVREAGNDWHLFVFSDDIDWCRENGKTLKFDKFKDITFVEGNVNGKNYIDLQLMSECKAMIMSNSSFCYLAALLNTKRQYVENPTRWEVDR